MRRKVQIERKREKSALRRSARGSRERIGYLRESHGNARVNHSVEDKAEEEGEEVGEVAPGDSSARDYRLARLAISILPATGYPPIAIGHVGARFA